MSRALDRYKPQAGLTATQADDVTLEWAGDRTATAHAVRTGAGTATIRELAVRRAGANWGVVAADAVPDYRITSGLRRMSNQQMAPLRGLGVELTNEIVDLYRWDPFWDAPLELGAEANRVRTRRPPRASPISQDCRERPRR